MPDAASLDRSHRLRSGIVAATLAAALLSDLIGYLVAFFQTDQPRSPQPALWWLRLALDVALLVASGVLIFRWRHLHPLWAMTAAASGAALVLAITPEMVLSFSFGRVNLAWLISSAVLPAVALYYVAQFRGILMTLAWFAASTGVQLLISTWRYHSWAQLLLVLGSNALLAVVAIGLGVRRHQLKDLIERSNLLTVERDQRAQLAVAAERDRIASEMHDIVSHSLAVMVTLADGAKRSLPDHPDTASEALDHIAATGRSAVTDMRRLLGLVHTATDWGPQPGWDELDALMTTFRQVGLPLTADLYPPADQDPALGLAVYRIIQEGLTNVLRHCPDPLFVKVGLRPLPGNRLVVEVLNGPSRQPARQQLGSGAGRGLVGLQQRVDLWQGQLESAMTITGGWRLRALLRY
ncbi:MAG: histidine kinase [Propionibacteriaceae bacterium]|jgi:signal transduction histidine kinase|nr:histidine kinase [Propionibacteriaceae bacterium]